MSSSPQPGPRGLSCILKAVLIFLGDGGTPKPVRQLRKQLRSNSRKLSKGSGSCRWPRPPPRPRIPFPIRGRAPAPAHLRRPPWVPFADGSRGGASRSPGVLGLPRGAALLEGGGQVGEDRAPGTREQGSASVWPPRAVPLAGRGITGYLCSRSPHLGFIFPQRKAPSARRLA